MAPSMSTRLGKDNEQVRSTYRARNMRIFQIADLDVIEHNIQYNMLDERHLSRIALALLNELRRVNKWDIS